MSNAPDVVCYTDGGCRGNPGPGGWAFIAINPRSGHALERAGGERDTTNNRMEIMAALMALRSLLKPDLAVLIHSDSQYLIKAASEWLPGWKAKGWRRKDGPLKNVDQFQELDELLTRHRVTWKWVKGHSGERGNERVDELANAAMDRLAAGGEPQAEARVTWKL